MGNPNSIKILILEKRIYFLLASLFLLVCLILAVTLQKGDELVYFAGYRSAILNTIFLFITRFGEEHLYLAIIFISLFLSYRFCLTFIVAGLSSLLISYLSKSLFLQPRPFTYFSAIEKIDQLGTIDAYQFHNAFNSFPSGHTLAAFSLFTLIALIGRKQLWQYLAFFLASAVGVSRIYLGQHFVSDVGFGALIGISIGFFSYFILFESMKNKRNLDRSLL